LLSHSPPPLGGRGGHEQAKHAPFADDAGSQYERDKRLAVSTGWLSTLPCVHLPPIQLVVYQRPHGDLVLG
jgi:hypothetical protein